MRLTDVDSTPRAPMKGLDWFPATDAAATPIAGAVAAGCLFVWLATMAFAFQGARGLWDPDEGRYAIVALNMVDSGDYLVPRISNDHPHYAKPPLAYWAMAASMRGLGATEFAARLPNAVAFLLTGIVLSWMGRMLSLQRPWTATVIWATTLLPFVASNVATTDTMLAFFETLAVAGYCALRWDQRSSRQQVGRWLMWIAFGCGFLTKGPPALLPLLAMIVFERFALRPRPAVSLYAPAPMIVALSIGLSWFLLTVARDNSLVRYFLLDEFVYRVATDMHERNPGFVGLIKAYVPAVVVGTLPWAPLALWHALRKSRSTLPGASSPRDPDMKMRFVKVWIITMLVVFALAQSRLPLYLLPLAVPFALLAAHALEGSHVSSEKIFAVALIGSVSLVGLRYYASIVSFPRDSRALAQEFRRQNLPLPGQELIFVGSTPSYGLGFYLREHVDAVDDSRPSPTTSLKWQEILCEELQGHEHALLVVRRGREGEVERVVRGCANTAGLKPVGSLKSYALLRTTSSTS